MLSSALRRLCVSFWSGLLAPGATQSPKPTKAGASQAGRAAPRAKAESLGAPLPQDEPHHPIAEPVARRERHHPVAEPAVVADGLWVAEAEGSEQRRAAADGVEQEDEVGEEERLLLCCGLLLFVLWGGGGGGSVCGRSGCLSLLAVGCCVGARACCEHVAATSSAAQQTRGFEAAGKRAMADGRAGALLSGGGGGGGGGERAPRTPRPSAVSFASTAHSGAPRRESMLARE